MAEQPWYKNGLKFECQRCGNCCSGVPGHVWVSDEDIPLIAKHLDIDEITFRQRYIITKNAEGPRLAQRQNDDCAFYNSAHGCVIYEYRPRQCHTWPFWKSNVSKPKNWAGTSLNCPGMNQGKHRTADQIMALIEDDGLPEK